LQDVENGDRNGGIARGNSISKDNEKAGEEISYLRQSTISKRIPMMRETIPHEPQFALLYILFDRIIIIVLGNFFLCV
jgi:hypothetical protein